LITFIELGIGGVKEDRTPDLLRARQALYQLSYDPKDSKTAVGIMLVGLGGFEPPTSPLSGVRSNQLSYRPAGKNNQNNLLWTLILTSDFVRR
jgi:hypothetical protein